MVPGRTVTASKPKHTGKLHLKTSISTLTMVLFYFTSMAKLSFTHAYIGVRRNMSAAINHQPPTAFLRQLSNNQLTPDLIHRFHHHQQRIVSSILCSSSALCLQNVSASSTYTVQAKRLYQTSTALKGTVKPSEEQPSNESNQKPKTNQKSRKQRKRSAKTMQRIDRVLADRGVGTRSKTFELARSGRITMADHPGASHEERIRIKGPSEKVPSDAVLFLDGKELPGPTPLLLVYHKPKYMLSVMEDDAKYQDQQRRHLGQVLKPRYVRSGMHPVGRLDYDTTGLILFSSDGKLTQKLLHPRQGVEKEYVATVEGNVDEDELRAKLAEGVETTEGVHKATLVEVMASDGPLYEKDPNSMLVDSEWHGREDYEGPYSDVRLIVSEGKHRMVRRMLHNCGHSVVELRRERHGVVKLAGLKVGEFRMARDDEIEWASSLL